MKKFGSLLLAFLLVVSMAAGCKDDRPGADGNSGNGAVNMSAQPMTVSGEMDLSGFAVAGDNLLQDLRYWTDGESFYRDEIDELDGNQVLDYTSDMDTVKAYIEMLKENGYTQVDYCEGYKGGYYSWGLVCDAQPNAAKLEQMFTETPCHVSIHWTDSERSRFTMNVSPDLKVGDAGLRRDGSIVSLMPVGPSLGAGLLRMPDGSYQTSDGRLSAAVGTAMVIRDGVTVTCDAKFVISGGGEQVWIENYYRNEGIFMECPEHYLMQNDLLRLEDFARERPIEKRKDSLDSTRYDSPAIAIAHGENWIGPGINKTDYIDVSMRVMYLDRNGDAVFYFCAKFSDGEPREVEALCAVNTVGSGEVEDVTYLEVGDKLTLTYSGPDSASYQTYEWQVIEGADNVVIDGTGNKCKVKAVDAGGVTIRVVYSYTKKEPDVLTGIIRNASHVATQDYYFIIE